MGRRKRQAGRKKTKADKDDWKTQHPDLASMMSSLISLEGAPSEMQHMQATSENPAGSQDSIVALDSQRPEGADSEVPERSYERDCYLMHTGVFHLPFDVSHTSEGDHFDISLTVYMALMGDCENFDVSKPDGRSAALTWLSDLIQHGDAGDAATAICWWHSIECNDSSSDSDDIVVKAFGGGKTCWACSKQEMQEIWSVCIQSGLLHSLCGFFSSSKNELSHRGFAIGLLEDCCNAFPRQCWAVEMLIPALFSVTKDSFAHALREGGHAVRVLHRSIACLHNLLAIASRTNQKRVVQAGYLDLWLALLRSPYGDMFTIVQVTRLYGSCSEEVRAKAAGYQRAVMELVINPGRLEPCDLKSTHNSENFENEEESVLITAYNFLKMATQDVSTLYHSASLPTKDNDFVSQFQQSLSFHAHQHPSKQIRNLAFKIVEACAAHFGGMIENDVLWRLKKDECKDLNKRGTIDARKQVECSSPCCHRTPTDGFKFKTCSRCHICFYCSVECQQRHWKFEGHREVCQSK